MIVREVLKTKVADTVRVGPDDTLTTAAGAIAAARKGLAIVCDGQGALRGVISVIDINRAVAERGDQAPSLRVREVMNPEVVVCSTEASVEDALALMATHHLRHLPVVEGEVVLGRVNMSDLLKVRFEKAEMAVEEMRSYVFGVGYRFTNEDA